MWKFVSVIVASLLFAASPAFANSPDGTVSLAPSGAAVTTNLGTFTWGAIHSGTTENEILLNGSDTTGYGTTMEVSCNAGVDQSVVVYSNLTFSWWAFVSGTTWVAAPVPTGLPCPTTLTFPPFQVTTSAGGAPTNSITLTNPTATTVTNYPYQFGRPFVDGAIPHSPMVLVNGTAVPSQSDIKNRYPDGSVEFAVISAVVPTIEPTACDLVNNNPSEMPPYAVWAAHGNSPVFNTPYYHSSAPSTVNVLQGPCAQFSGSGPKSLITMRNIAAQSQIGGEWGLTEAPSTYAIISGTMFSSMIASNTSWCPVGICIGLDEETGGIWEGTTQDPGSTPIVPTANGDEVDIITDAGGAGPATVYYNGAQVAQGPTSEAINTAGYYAEGADGDHVYNGPLIAFDQIATTQVIAPALAATISAEFNTFYANSGSAAPVVCSTPGLTCNTAFSWTQRLVAGATTAFNLYNKTTGAYQDIGFTANGNVDTAAANAFCGTVANCLEHKQYDQVGEVNNLQKAVLTFADTTTSSTPMTTTAMEAMLPVGAAKMTLTPATGPAYSADAGQMLLDGNCTNWTQGAIATTLYCGDDSATRKYDIGWDSYKPFRPHFYVTLWPTTNQVYVRALGENDLATQLEDLSYTLTLSNGYVRPLNGSISSGGFNLVNWTNTWWTKTWWNGTAPPQAVNIDNNLAYLDYTHFFPNLDTTLTVNPSDLYTAYNCYMAGPHDIYDGDWDGQCGSVAWTTAQGTGGDSPHLGPFPGQEQFWLHSPDWRARYIALNQADISVAWNSMYRESDPTRPFNRGDAAGTGLGHVISAPGRPGWVNGPTSDYPTGVGTISANPWQGTTDHQPDPYFAPYVATGDKFYLDAMQFVAGYSVFRNAASSPYVCTNQAPNCDGMRGPTGAYGGLFGFHESRDVAWTVRGRAETAFASVDGSPEKRLFLTMMNDAIAKWEGSVGITGTPFDTATVKTWIEGVSYNGVPMANPWCNPYTASGLTDVTSFPNIYGSPPDGMLNCDQAAGNISDNSNLTANDLTFDNNWMESYVGDGLGRAVELGFVSLKPMLTQLAHYPVDLLNSSYPWGLASYSLGSSNVGTKSFYPTWANYFANSTDPNYWPLLKTNWPGDWETASGIDATPRELYALPGIAVMVDQGIPGAAAAWSWLNTNGYQLGLGQNAVFSNIYGMRWAVLPRPSYDTVVLPPQPTTELP